MNKQDSISLFNSIYPDFFEREGICNLAEELIFEEMILPLSRFDANRYEKRLKSGVSFGFYEGDPENIEKAVEKVDPAWVPYFNGKNRIYCGYADGKIASFCLVEHLGTYCVGGVQAKIGAPGCVGTVPEYRRCTVVCKARI